MDENKNILDELLEQKKKSPTTQDIGNFSIEWNKYVLENGFSPDAEKYLYMGYTYCSGTAFYNYMKTNENPMVILRKLHEGIFNKQQSTNKTGVLVNILAAALNDKHHDLNVIAFIIKQIPTSVRNKENKFDGNIKFVIKNYFYNKLELSAEYPDLKKELSSYITQAALQDFIDVLNLVLPEIEKTKLTKSCKTNIKKVNEWLQPKFGEESTDSEPISQEVTSKKSEPVDNTVAQLTDTENNFSKEKKEQLKETLKKLKTIIKAKERQIDELKSLNNKYQSEVEKYQSENNKLQTSIDIKEEALLFKNNALSQSNECIALLKNDKERLTKQLEELQQQHDKAVSMNSMLRKTDDSELEKFKNKVAASLRYDYKDYLDAMDIEMSMDLGENMRLQLGDIFNKLISLGVNLK